MNSFINLNNTELNEIKRALSLISSNEWEKAHEIAQSKEGNLGYDRIHALLHRIEGDKFNARYWYNRCNLSLPTISFEEELTALTTEINAL